MLNFLKFEKSHPILKRVNLFIIFMLCLIFITGIFNLKIAFILFMFLAGVVSAIPWGFSGFLINFEFLTMFSYSLSLIFSPIFGIISISLGCLISQLLVNVKPFSQTWVNFVYFPLAALLFPFFYISTGENFIGALYVALIFVFIIAIILFYYQNQLGLILAYTMILTPGYIFSIILQDQFYQNYLKEIE